MTRQLFNDADAGPRSEHGSGLRSGLPSELPSGLRSPEAAPCNLAAMARAAVALLAELEASLVASQRSLLSRDLEGLERATSEQIGLHRSLQTLRSHDSAQSNGAQNDGAQSNDAQKNDAAPGNDAPPLDPALAAGLRAAQWRVLYLGRVQAALLTRAQRSLRMLSNLLAGPAASYAAPSYPAPSYPALAYAAPSHAAPAPASNRLKPWPGWPASGASARPGNDERNQLEPREERKKNSNRDEEEADPCRV
jgi:hypothetical protein